MTQQQLAVKTINLRFPETFAAAKDQVQGFDGRLQTVLNASGSQARVGESRETEREPQFLSVGGKRIGFFAYLPHSLLRSSKLGQGPSFDESRMTQNVKEPHVLGGVYRGLGDFKRKLRFPHHAMNLGLLTQRESH